MADNEEPTDDGHDGVEAYDNTLDALCDGKVVELYDAEVMKLAANILDLNTKATQKRTVTIKIDFEPTESRKEARITASVSSKLAGAEAVKAHAYVGREGGVIRITEFDPEQPMLFNTPLRDVRKPKKNAG